MVLRYRKKLRIGQQGGDTIQAAASQQFPLVQRLQGPASATDGLGWQRRPHRFLGGAAELSGACGFAALGALPRTIFHITPAYLGKLLLPRVSPAATHVAAGHMPHWTQPAPSG